MVRLRDIRANKVHLGGSSLPGRLLAGNITSETFLKRIGEMFSLGGWNGSNRHAAPPRAEIASSRTKLRCASDTRQSILGAHKDITRMVQEYGAGARCWIVASFHARTFFFSFHFLPLLFSSIPCLPRAQEGVYARGSSNERMQIVATTLSVIFFNAELMPPPDLSVSDHPLLLLLPLPQYPRPKLYGIYVNDSY